MVWERDTKESPFLNNSYYAAIAIMVGLIVGAGILGIPYIIAKTGFFIGLAIIVAIGLVFLVLNLYMGEIVLRTKGRHQLTGYMEKYLGKFGKLGMMFSMMFGIYGALTAYLIGEGETLRTIFAPIIDLPAAVYIILFLTFCGFFMLRGLKQAGKMELLTISIMLFVIFLISILSLPFFEISNVFEFHPEHFLLPLGVIIFSFISSASVPEVAMLLEKDKKKIKKALIIGSVIPIFIYIVFSLSIIGAIGIEQFDMLEPNQRIATVALSFYTTPLLGLFANLFAVAAMATSFVALGIALMQMYQFDYKLSKKMSFGLVLVLPLVLALSNISSFITVLGITGIIAGALDGILIVLAHWKVKKMGSRKPEFSISKSYLLGSLLILVFVIGLVHQLYLAI
jgi:tyrosine-specific transport protein